MVIVAVFAHCPSIGVNVYSVVSKLFSSGDQVPSISLTEVVSKATIVAPEQIALTCVNVGFVFGVVATVTAIETAVPQSPVAYA
jgi:hypothetical protein